MTRSGLQALLALGAVAIASAGLAQEQMADPDFRPVVASPAYAQDGPTVLLDEAHGSVQTAEGRKTTVFAIKLTLANPDGRLKPGMPADVTFDDGL